MGKWGSGSGSDHEFDGGGPNSYAGCDKDDGQEGKLTSRYVRVELDIVR